MRFWGGDVLRLNFYEHHPSEITTENEMKANCVPFEIPNTTERSNRESSRMPRSQQETESETRTEFIPN